MGQPPVGGDTFYVKIRPGDKVVVDADGEGVHVTASSKRASFKIRYGRCRAGRGNDRVPVAFDPYPADVTVCRATSEFKVDAAIVVKMEPRT